MGKYGDAEIFVNNYYKALKILESFKKYMYETKKVPIEQKFILDNVCFYIKFNDNREFLITINGFIYSIIDNKKVLVKDNSWQEYYES